ncbi:hypothetical protein ACS8FD_06865 [Psychrobacter sp. 1U2]|uniref:hypothetical protein n=1 Tax=Psychrobacter sp. 1U2 TaxID=3453577 RepID=UPI003F452219
MKKLLLEQLFQNKLKMALLASVLALSACSTETEESTDTNEIESSEVTPVNEDSSEMIAGQTENVTEGNINDAEDTDDAGGSSYYSSTENEEEIDDTVYVNENNSNLDKTAADGLQ